LQKVTDEAMSNLSIKDEIANDVVLTYQSRSVFTEIMEDLHYLLGLHDFFKSVLERINGFHVNKKAFVGVVYLDKLHAPVFGQTLAVNSENRCIVVCSGIYDAL